MTLIRAERIREIYQNLLVFLQQQKNQQTSLSDFSYALKHDPQIKKIKNKTRNELQTLYDEMRDVFNLPRASVFLPFRKKINVRGRAGKNFSLKTEIRVYPVKGPNGIAYRQWTPDDLQFLTVEQLFSTFIHEVAHIHEKNTFGKMGNHGPEFCASERKVGEYLQTHGFKSLMTYPLSQGPYVPWSRGTHKRRVDGKSNGTGEKLNQKLILGLFIIGSLAIYFAIIRLGWIVGMDYYAKTISALIVIIALGALVSWLIKKRPG